MITLTHLQNRLKRQCGATPCLQFVPLNRIACGRNISGRRLGFCAFTMIEVMIVIGIAGVIMALGIPAFVKVLNKDPLRQTISDMLEACTEARAQAIISGMAAEIRIRPGERSIAIGPATRESDSSQPEAQNQDERETESRPVARQVTGKGFPKTMSTRVRIEMLDVNLKEFKDSYEARVRFFPNGTCDEFTFIVSYADSNEYRQITLDSISGMATVGVIR